MIDAILLGFCAACIGFVHSIVLWNDDTPLNFLYRWLTWMEDRVPKLAKPLGACILCFSGQVALWSSVILYEGIIHHFAAAGCGVTFAYFISKAHGRLEKP